MSRTRLSTTVDADLLEIRDTFKDDSEHTYAELFEQLRSLDLLAIDDMGT